MRSCGKKERERDSVGLGGGVGVAGTTPTKQEDGPDGYIAWSSVARGTTSAVA